MILQNRLRERAASHRDLYAPKRIFSRNTASKIHGRRQPCRGFFLCLAIKSLALECFAVLRERFFLTGAVAGRRNTVCILRPRRCLWGKRFPQNRVNPYVRPPKAHLFAYSDRLKNCRQHFKLQFAEYIPNGKPMEFTKISLVFLKIILYFWAALWYYQKAGVSQTQLLCPLLGCGRKLYFISTPPAHYLASGKYL